MQTGDKYQEMFISFSDERSTGGCKGETQQRVWGPLGLSFLYLFSDKILA